MEPPEIVGTKGVLVHMGLGQPLARAFVGATVVGVAAYALGQPEFAFDDKGEMRPFKGVSKLPTSTYAHFLAVPIVAGAAVYLFT